MNSFVSWIGCVEELTEEAAVEICSRKTCLTYFSLVILRGC
jgi:hypothetical protein